MIPVGIYRKLYSSLKEQRQVETDLLHHLDAVLGEKYISSKTKKKLGPLKYAQKNFFSILFLAIYKALGILPEKRKHYGMINHCLRGIITGADNLLDDEYKEMLPLNFPEPAIRFKSVMHILLFDRFIVRVTNTMAKQNLLPGNVDVADLQQKLFDAIVPIGAEEAQEEGGVHQILSPAEILSTVHIYKGGKLLCLAFVAPLLVEESLQEKLTLAQSGIYNIGIALQLIDDLTDFYEDIAHSNHNYLVSCIHHLGSDNEKRCLGQALHSVKPSGKAIEEQYPKSVELVMAESIGQAMYGFELLENAGFWVNRNQAYELIKSLFVLRGVRHLLPFFPNKNNINPPAPHAAG